MPVKNWYELISSSLVGKGPIAMPVFPDIRERLFCVASILSPANLISGLDNSDTKG